MKSENQIEVVRVTRMPWKTLLVGLQEDLVAGGIAYEGDPEVHAPVCEEPVHEGPLRWHHVRILSRSLSLALLLAEWRAICSRL